MASRIKKGETIACVVIALLLVGSAAIQVLNQPAALNLSVYLSEAIPGPRPDLAPDDVVRLHLEALRHNDAPYTNAGIETAFRLASPTNQLELGSPAALVPIVSNPIYRPMINHEHAVFGKVEVTGLKARQAVVLIDAEGEPAGYVFSLVRQEDALFAGCWMIESVLRVSVVRTQRTAGEARSYQV